MVIDRLILEGRLTQLALMQVFTILPICLSPVIGIVNQLVHFAEVSELAGINFRHGGPNPGNCSLLLSSNMAIHSS